MTNGTPGAIGECGQRWDIERGYKSIKRFMAATTSNAVEGGNRNRVVRGFSPR